MCKGVFRENILEKDENDVINEKNNEKNAILSKSSQFLRKLKEDSFVFSSKECHNTRDFDTGFDKIPSVSFSPSSHRLSTPSHSETKEGHDTTGFDKIPFVSFSPSSHPLSTPSHFQTTPSSDYSPSSSPTLRPLSSPSQPSSPFHLQSSPSFQLNLISSQQQTEEERKRSSYDCIVRDVDSPVDQYLITKFRLIFLGVIKNDYMKQVRQS